MPNNVSKLLTTKDLAELLGAEVSTLNCNRSKGVGIPFIKVGRLVRYRMADVDTYLDSHRVEVTGG